MEEKFSGKHAGFIVPRRSLPRPTWRSHRTNKQKCPRNRPRMAVHRAVCKPLHFSHETVGPRVCVQPGGRQLRKVVLDTVQQVMCS